MKHVDIFIKHTMKSMKESKAKYAYVLVYKLADNTDFIRTGVKTVRDTTKNGITLMAIIDAMSRMRDTVDCTIYIDNYHIYNMLKRDMPRKWKAHNYINAKGKQIKDTGKWQVIYKMMNNNYFHVVRGEYPNKILEQLSRLLMEDKEDI